MSDRVRPGRFFLFICVTGALAILSSTMSKNPVLNPFAESLGTPAVLMGVIAAASTLPGVLISLPAGSLSDIFGWNKTLLVSSIVFASAPFLYILTSSWWQLVLVRFYHGFATAIFIPVARAAIAEHYPSRKGERISTFTSATIVGRSIAPFIGGLILSVTIWSYHTLYLTVGVAGVTTLLATLALLKEGRPESKEHSDEQSTEGFEPERRPESTHGWREVSRNLGIMVASAVEAGSYYVYGAIEFFLTGYLKNVSNLDPSLIGIIMSMQLALIPIVIPFTGRLSDRVGRRIPIIVGLVISSLPLIAITYAVSFLHLLLISVAYGLGFSMVTSSTPALVSDLASEKHYGAAMGFLATVMDVGQMLGPVITGIILAVFGYSGSFFSLGAILLSFCVLFIICQKSASSQRLDPSFA